jgi:hypothetical protein
MSSDFKQNIHTKIDLILNDYKDNPDMLLKVEDYIINQLPSQMININNTQLERETRKHNLESKSHEFIETFFKKSPYYYCTTSEIFFEYKDGNYNCIREDSVMYNILNSISAHKVLLPWKYKMKVSIMKRIKEKEIFSSTPNSETIQYVLTLMKDYFNMPKELSKYFHTIIGDIMLKKNNLIYFVNSDIKNLLKELNSNGYLLFGTPSITTHFKFKYHEHNYNDCRLVNYKGRLSEEFVKTATKNNMINLLLVACYFSNKYENADNFVKDFCKDFIIRDHALYLKNNNENTIIQDFMNEMTEEMTEESTEISIQWKDINYLWKMYNEKHNFPNIMFLGPLKVQLIERFGEKYNSESEIFTNITSSYLPDVIKFVDFWSTEIYETDEQIEYEIDEIYNLFQSSHKCNTMTEEKLLGLIKHYNPDVIIEDNKYFLNIGCHMWNKKTEAQDYVAVNNIENFDGIEKKDGMETNMEQFYESYKKQNSNPKRRLSKRYFEKYISECF